MARVALVVLAVAALIGLLLYTSFGLLRDTLLASSAIPMALVGGIFAFRSWIGTAAGRYQWEAITLRMPVAGKILHKAALARFAAWPGEVVRGQVVAIVEP